MHLQYPVCIKSEDRNEYDCTVIVNWRGWAAASRHLLQHLRHLSAKVVSTSANSASALQAFPVSQRELLAVHDRQGHGRQLRTTVMSEEIRKLTYFPELNPQPWQAVAVLQTFITDHFPTVSAVLNLLFAVLHLLFSNVTTFATP